MLKLAKAAWWAAWWWDSGCGWAMWWWVVTAVDTGGAPTWWPWWWLWACGWASGCGCEWACVWGWWCGEEAAKWLAIETATLLVAVLMAGLLVEQEDEELDADEEVARAWWLFPALCRSAWARRGRKIGKIKSGPTSSIK